MGGGGLHSLPRFSTTFVGRERETGDLIRLVRDNRFEVRHQRLEPPTR
jgi:hypothetical protein